MIYGGPIDAKFLCFGLKRGNAYQNCASLTINQYSGKLWCLTIPYMKVSNLSWNMGCIGVITLSEVFAPLPFLPSLQTKLYECKPFSFSGMVKWPIKITSCFVMLLVCCDL